MILDNEKGGGLIMVIVLMAVLMILATTFLGLTSTEGKQTARYHNKIQAYHYAMAGVEFAFQVLDNNYLNGNLQEGFPEGSFPAFFNGNLGDGFKTGDDNKENISVEILEDEEGLQIKSIGRIENIEELITIRIPKLQGEEDNDEGNDGGRPTLPPNQGVIISGNIELAGSAKIIGDATLGGNVNTSGSALITGTVNKKLDMNFSMPSFPQYPENLPVPPNIPPINNGNLVVGQYPHHQYTVSSDGVYNKIQIVSNGILNIDVGEETRILRVKELDLQQGHLVIQGSGRLILYIEDKFQMKGSINNLAENKYILGNPQQMTVFYGGTSPVVVGGNDVFVGDIFSNRGNIQINAGANISGNVITGGSSVEIGGGTDVNIPLLYAPNAYVNGFGGAKLEGVVVANSLSATGNVEFVYKNNASQLFPELIWGSGNGGSGGSSYGPPVWGN